jgi:hypothetical protein
MRGSDGLTGHLFESQVLGECRVKWDGSYRSYASSMELVRANQPGDPMDPATRTANDLHALVAEQLGLDDYAKLGFYTAVRSPLDFFHGVDAFFEFQGVVVTMDLTLNPHKDEAKAHIVIHPKDLENLPFLAAWIADGLRSKEAV